MPSIKGASIDPRSPQALLAVTGDYDFSTEKLLSMEQIAGQTFVNTSGGNLRVYFNGSYRPTNAAMIMRDGQICPGLFCSSTGERSVNDLVTWVNLHPIRVAGLQVESDNTAQLNQMLKVQTKVTFVDEPERNLAFSTAKSTSAANDKLIILKNPNFQFDVDTEISIVIPGVMNGEVPGSVTSTFTWSFGAYGSQSEQLFKLGKVYGTLINSI